MTHWVGLDIFNLILEFVFSADTAKIPSHFDRLDAALRITVMSRAVPA
jgi:hypothetical protein